MVRQRSTPPVTRRRLLESGAVLSASGLLAVNTQGRVSDRMRDQRGGTQASLTCGTTVTGELTSDDTTGFRSPGHYQDEYTFEAESGAFVAITMQTSRRESRGTATRTETDTGPQTESETATETTTGTETGSPNGTGAETGTPADTGTSTTTRTGTPVDDQPPDDAADPYLYLLGPDGAIVAEDDDSAGGLDASLTVPAVPTGGTYTVVATSFAPGETFSYALTLECGSPFEPTPIECGTTVTGELTPDDATGYVGPDHAQDAYSFEGEAESVVDVSMTALGQAADASFRADPFLLLLDPGGIPIAADDDSGGDLNARLTAILPTAGEYTIVATSFAPDQAFAYELGLDCRPPLEPEPISCGETVAGELTTEDASGVRTDFGTHYHDVYAFTGAAGEQITLSMESRPGTDGSFGDPYLYLFGPDGVPIAEDDDCGGGTNALLRQRLPADGEYTVVATSFGAEESFAYDLTLACENPPVPLPEPTPLTCGETVVGELGPDDAAGFRGLDVFYDTYAFEGEAGESVTLSLSASMGDPYLYLLGPDGTVVAEDDDGGGNFDSLIRAFELQQSGSYTVIATSFAEREFFEYNLMLQCDAGDGLT
jgi:hypothetical protein